MRLATKLLLLRSSSTNYNVVNLGVMVAQEEYIAAAIETNADAILVSSMYGHGEIDCQGLRQKMRRSRLKKVFQSLLVVTS